MTAVQTSALDPSPACPAPASNGAAHLDVERVRQDFPILNEMPYAKPLVYLDSAATSQKPQAVIDAISGFCSRDNANVHQGVHYLSGRATEAHEGSRAKVRGFLNPAHAEEIVFAAGTTKAINLVARTYARTHLEKGDEVLITAMEHHSNIVAWQMVCAERGAPLWVAPSAAAGELLLDELERLVGLRTPLVAVTHVSNVLGTVNPIRAITEIARAWGRPRARRRRPGRPTRRHRRVGPGLRRLRAVGPQDVRPRRHRRPLRPPRGARGDAPYQGGGDMIASVSFEKAVYHRPPYKAGTPNLAGAVGLGAALDFLGGLGHEALAAHEHDVLAYGLWARSALSGPHDIATIVDCHGVAIRTGHYCAQPLLSRLGLSATARASLACHSTRREIDALVVGLATVQEAFR